MKKLFVVLGLLLVVTMLFVGCKGKTDNSSITNSQLPPQDYNKTGTLQGKIMDAVTGDPLGDSDLKVWLIQGTDNRGPSKLITDINDPLVGEYAFSGIPVSFDFNDNACFMVIVVKSGYKQFEAEICMGSSYTSNDTGDLLVIDNVTNMIGNIYLFPLGTTAGDISVYVYHPNGAAVANATVLLKQNASNNNITANTGNRLNPASGLYSSLTTTTDAAGLA